MEGEEAVKAVPQRGLDSSIVEGEFLTCHIEMVKGKGKVVLTYLAKNGDIGELQQVGRRG